MPRVLKRLTNAATVTSRSPSAAMSTRIACHRRLPVSASSHMTMSWQRNDPHIQNARRLLASPFSSLVVASARSSLAVPEEDDDYDPTGSNDDESTTTTAPSTIQSRLSRRPRLEALRSSLASEQQEQTISSSSSSTVSAVPPFLSEWKTKKGSSLKTTTPTTPHSTANTLQDLRQRLALLPDPPTLHSALVDLHARHHSYLRLSLTERCNLRCTYCMPEQGVPLQASSQLLSTSELLYVARLFAQAGVTKWRLTGGEPTLRSDLHDVIAGLYDIATATRPQSIPSIGITTNGIVLANKLADFHAAGLTSVNISLDTLDREKFATLTRRPATYLDRVWDSIKAAMALASSSTFTSDNGRILPPLVVKINVVVMRGVNDDEMADFVRLTHQYPGIHVRFIEYMPFADNGWDWSKCVPYQEIVDNLSRRDDESVHLERVESDDPNDTTKWFVTKNSTNSSNSNSTTSSRIGFITSMSEHFCATCNRLRITADGTIKVCLFDGRSDTATTNDQNTQSTRTIGGLVSLRDAIRAQWTEPELYKLIHQTVQTKHAKLGGHDDPKDIASNVDRNRPMTLIGG